AFDRLYDRFLENKYDLPSFALKLGHKDMRLATELGRELAEPMRLANMAFAEMTEATQPRLRGPRQPFSPAAPARTLRLKVEVDPQRIQEVLDRDFHPTMAVPSASKTRKPPRGHSRRGAYASAH